MKHLGNILHLANSGKLIVTSEQMPPAHGFVYTNDRQKIGKVYNVFGPVKNPYISVSLFKSVNRRDLESRAGEKLYVSTKKELEKSKASKSRVKNSKGRKKSKDKSFKNQNSKDKRSRSNKQKNKSKRFNQKIKNRQDN